MSFELLKTAFFAANKSHFDTYYNNVILQIANNNMANNSTTTVDQSVNNQTVSFFGAAKNSTTTAPSGMSSSLSFDGNRSWVSVPDAAYWDLGATTWTVEAKVLFNNLTNYGTLICQIGAYPGSGQAAWWIILPKTGDANVYFEWTTNGSTWNYVPFAWTPTTGVWYDFMLVRNGTSMECYVNGSKIGSTQTVSGTFFNSNTTVDIGGVSGQGAVTYDLNGYISNLRFTGGIARTPYMPAAELPVDAAPWNYTTLNPFRTNFGGIALSNGNLTAAMSTTAGGTAMSIRGYSSGKRYFEFTATSTYPVVGVVNASASYLTNTYPGIDANGWGYYSTGNKYNSGTNSAYGATFTTGDIIGVLVDWTAGTITFYKNGVSQGVAFSGLSGTLYAAVGDYSVAAGLGTFNFGATAFTYSIPSGALAWGA